MWKRVDGVKAIERSVERRWWALSSSRLLASCVAMGFSVLGIMVMSDYLKADTARLPFASEVDTKIRVGLVSKYNESEKTEFLDLIRQADSGGEIDTEKWTNGLQSTDVIIFILSEWSDVKQMPFQEVFSEYYRTVADSAIADVKVTVRLSVNNGQPFLLIFYNTKVVPKVTKKCFAEDFVQGLTLGEALISKPLIECK